MRGASSFHVPFLMDEKNIQYFRALYWQSKLEWWKNASAQYWG